MRSKQVKRDATMFAAGVVLAAVGVFIVLLAKAGADANTAEQQASEPTPTRANPVVLKTSAETEIEPDTDTTENLDTPEYSEAAELIGRTIWGEAGGIPDKAERAAVAWCILNRVDAWGITLEEAVTAPHQFQGYRSAEYWGDCPQEHIELARDVLIRWHSEKIGATNSGRVLPADYLYFMGDGAHNHFTTEWKGSDFWAWTLPNPYQ